MMVPYPYDVMEAHQCPEAPPDTITLGARLLLIPVSSSPLQFIRVSWGVGQGGGIHRHSSH